MMRILTNVFYAGLLVVWPLVALGVWSRLWPDEAAFAVELAFLASEPANA
jgi:hypothetical protein